jgi:ubiquinone/menaquinone biosynthesis C-methylase UbiE
MKFKDYFSDVARDYARARPAYPAALYQLLADLAPARKRAWDCATGSGQAAIGLSAGFEEVQASDASPDQITEATGPDNIIYSVQPAEKTTFGDNSFDLVNVATALHWFDLERFYREVHRVLRPGGVFAAYGYLLFRISPELDSVVSDHIFDPLDPYWPPESRLVREGYKSLVFPFDEIEMPQLEMRLKWDFDDLSTYLGTWSSLASYVRKFGPEPMQKSLAQVAIAWGNPATKRQVTMDLVGRIGRLGSKPEN